MDVLLRDSVGGACWHVEDMPLFGFEPTGLTCRPIFDPISLLGLQEKSSGCYVLRGVAVPSLAEVNPVCVATSTRRSVACWVVCGGDAFTPRTTGQPHPGKTRRLVVVGPGSQFKTIRLRHGGCVSPCGPLVSIHLHRTTNSMKKGAGMPPLHSSVGFLGDWVAILFVPSPELNAVRGLRIIYCNRAIVALEFQADALGWSGEVARQFKTHA